MIRKILAYRDFILGSVKREFQLKYRNSILGAAWTVIQPAAMILVYTVVFSQVMRARFPGADSPFAYSIYLCAGVLTWGLFAEILGRSVNVFIDNANIMKKINFPRICLPVILLLNALINFLLIFGLFVLFLLFSGNFPGWVMLGLLPVLFLLLAFALGLGITLGVLNVFFRDVGQMLGVALQFWFWLTPVVYSATILPPVAQKWLPLNPMVAVINAFQTVLVLGKWPDWGSLLPVSGLAVLFCMSGLVLFRRHVGEMVDEL